MRIAIVGSRDGLPWARVSDAIRDLVRRPDVTSVVSGGALGVDRLAESLALAAGKHVVAIRPDWQRFGKSAGYRRNVEIVAQADEVYAFWNGTSKGTKHSIDIANKMRKPVYVVQFVDAGADVGRRA